MANNKVLEGVAQELKVAEQRIQEGEDLISFMEDAGEEPVQQRAALTNLKHRTNKFKEALKRRGL